MATTIKLCDTCAKIPFDAEDPPAGESLQDRWDMGTLSQTRKKTYCPLCRIIVAALFDQHRGYGTYSLSDQRLTLRWLSYAEPGGSFFVEEYGPDGHLVTGDGFGTKICFVDELNNPNSATQRGSFLANSRPELDLDRVRRWMSACIHDHGDYCNPIWSHLSPSGSPIPGLGVLRLVDVINGCLVEVRSPCRYLTLSYVWGGFPNFRLTTSNKSRLMQRGILQSIWKMLPRTVQDSIDLVKALGEHYLWIDALCLVQNDGTDLQKGVDIMDLIYERAVMTIVAAAGDNANACLPGVREGSRFITQHIEQIKPGVELAVYNDLDHLLRLSTYNRRAWT
jgi:hypothetical protein